MLYPRTTYDVSVQNKPAADPTFRFFRCKQQTAIRTYLVMKAMTSHGMPCVLVLIEKQFEL